LVVGICLLHSSPGWAGSPASPNTTYVQSAIRSSDLPLSFEANQGQVDNQVRYLARGQGYTLFLTSQAAVLGLRKEGVGKPTKWVRLVLQGAATAPEIAGEQMLPGESHYFVGNDPSQWRTKIPTFSRVRYQQVYPGVDLIYYGRQGRLENDFEVNAGTDPDMISWHVEGADGIRVNPTGDLVMTVGASEVQLQQPRAYQLDGGQQREVPVSYRVHGQNVSFALGKYNRNQKLVIDPVLTYSTYLGGTGGDVAYGVTVDSAGEAYVTGVTASTNFPVTSSGYQSTYSGDGDVFVTKFNSAGTGILFSTYLGGSGLETPAQILLDSSRDMFVVGSTSSSNFPVTSGAFQQIYGGNQDAFLTELKPDGSALIYSTYIGGTGADFGTAVTLDTLGNAYVAGSTQSKDFPTKNPLQLGNVGLSDAFVTEVDPTGKLVYSTYLGGSLADYGTGIAVQKSGSAWNVYLCGYTSSTDFPTQSALQSSLSGGTDIFITEFTPGSSALLFSTYLGGSSNDRAFAMIVDASGNIFLTGDTQSTNFPVTATAYQSSVLGTANAFLTKIGPGATTLVYSTIFGGSGTDQATSMALDAAGNIYITGFTQSGNFPLLDSFQNVLGISGAGTCGSTNLLNVTSQALCADAFVAKFGPSGIPIYSSFLGGNGTDSGQGIAVDSTGAVYVAGGSTSTNFPVTSGAFQWLYQGSTVNGNAFLTKISPQDGPSLALTPQQINFGNQPILSTSNPVTVTLTNEGSAAFGIAQIAADGDFQQTNTCGTSLSAGGSTCTIQVTFTPNSAGLQTDQVAITDSTGGSHAITVTGNGVTTGGSLLLSPSKLTFPAQVVGATSPSQTVLLINNGNQAVTITNILSSGGFGQTNTCGNFPTTPAVLNVGQACTIAVSFSPTSTGSTTGTIEITSNAVTGATALNLVGTGTPVFSLSSNARSNVLLIGSQTATFTVSAVAPSTFLAPIALSCSSAATCTFNPSSISGGQSSTLTITGIKSTTANPLNFVITGSSGQQSATLALTLFFADFSLAATPSGTTVTAGNNAVYTVTVTPTNGFNAGVLLSCGSIPQDAVCYWNPPAVALTGTNATASSTLTITTVAQSRLLHRPPPPGVPPGLGRWILLCALLTLSGAVLLGLNRSGTWMPARFKFVALLVTLVLVSLAVVGCQNYVNPININPVINGTPSGTFNIVLTGTLGNSSAVTRTATITMSVQP